MPGKKHNLTPGKVYDVIGLECDDYRIINDRNDPRLGLDPVLYPPTLFDVVDATEPSEWVFRIEEGCRYAYPPEFAKPGFWETYHDGKPEALGMFRDYMRQLQGKKNV
jgi:hypothetical protein